MAGTMALLERTADDRKREIERLQVLLETTNKRYEEKNMELTASNMQLKHLAMEKEMVETSWKQKVEELSQRNKELIK
jgi:hypothetical protein